jgi:hypothetical protein
VTARIVTPIATLARRPDIDQLASKLVLGELSPEETREALVRCVEYIEKIEIVIDDLRDKCAETARLLE